MCFEKSSWTQQRTSAKWLVHREENNLFPPPPLERHWIWKEWKWPKRNVKTLGFADGLVRRKTSGLYLKEAMIQRGPKIFQQPGCWKWAGPKVRWNGQSRQKGHTARDLSFPFSWLNMYFSLLLLRNAAPWYETIATSSQQVLPHFVSGWSWKDINCVLNYLG